MRLSRSAARARASPCADRRATQVVLLLSATARLDPTGAIVGMVSIGQDITEHKSLEERKMRFMAVVSHELRSPIHGICGLSDALAISEKDGCPCGAPP